MDDKDMYVENLIANSCKYMSSKLRFFTDTKSVFFIINADSVFAYTFKAVQFNLFLECMRQITKSNRRYGKLPLMSSFICLMRCTEVGMIVVIVAFYAYFYTDERMQWSANDA